MKSTFTQPSFYPRPLVCYIMVEEEDVNQTQHRLEAWDLNHSVGKDIIDFEVISRKFIEQHMTAEFCEKAQQFNVFMRLLLEEENTASFEFGRVNLTETDLSDFVYFVVCEDDRYTKGKTDDLSKSLHSLYLVLEDKKDSKSYQPPQQQGQGLGAFSNTPRFMTQLVIVPKNISDAEMKSLLKAKRGKSMVLVDSDEFYLLKQLFSKGKLENDIKGESLKVEICEVTATKQRSGADVQRYGVKITIDNEIYKIHFARNFDAFIYFCVLYYKKRKKDFNPVVLNSDNNLREICSCCFKSMGYSYNTFIDKGRGIRMSEINDTLLKKVNHPAVWYFLLKISEKGYKVDLQPEEICLSPELKNKIQEKQTN